MISLSCPISMKFLSPQAPAHEQPPLRLRIISAALLGVFCLATYGACNTIAVWRQPERCLAMAWEYQIPRINWTVVPYWFLDIMVVAAPIIAQRYDEWRTLIRRMVLAFLIACVVFLVFPCRCGYERSIPDDWTAWMFRLLHATDHPYNQAPSLHVCEAIFTAPVLLARFNSRIIRATIVAWFALGALATLLTWQHHLVDVITGAMLGFGIVALVRKR